MGVKQRTDGGGTARLLREEIFEYIRQDIITGALPQGELLNESELASRFGTSKTPVREALTRLRQTSLVELIPRKGFLVTPISVTDIQEIFEMRLILERAAAELAAVRITEDELEQLEEYREIAAFRNEPDSIYRAIKANRDFHIKIARASRNNRLISALERVFDDAQRLHYIDLQMGGFIKAWSDDHGGIIDALRARDVDLAREAVAAGLRETRLRMSGL